jgi:hypothetical protein
VPILRLGRESPGIRQERATRRGHIGQGPMGKPHAKAQAMPGEKRHRARAQPPSRIKPKPPFWGFVKNGFGGLGFAKNGITGHSTLLG